VATEERREKKQPGKGFAGLDSMLSDVDETIGKAEREVSTRSSDNAARPKPARPARQRASAPQPDPAAQPQPVRPPPAPHDSGSSKGKRLLKWGGLAFVVYLFWLGSSSNSPSSRRHYPQPHAKTGIEFPTPAVVTEERPPVGTNLVLGPAQLSYCVSEKIRIEGADKVVNTYLESDVNRFNTMVDDFNSRCGAFRYRQGALESTRRDVERIRLMLEAEGRRRFSSR
jgi:hypothetical protein